jgi:lysozyme family protein
MMPLGEAGASFRPEQDYFSISLVAVHMPAKLLNSAKFAPVVWASIRGDGTEDGKALVGLFPPIDAGKPQFARNDRIEIVDLQLTPRIIAREELTIDFTLGAIREKDYLGGVLGVVSELANAPAAAFFSQAVPVLAAVKQGVQFAEKVKQRIDGLLDADKLQALGKFLGTLRAPIRSGLVAFTDSRAEPKNVSFNEAQNCLMTSGGPMKSAYAVLRFQREEYRPDWKALPDVNMAWVRIREAARARGDIKDAISLFRVTALTSPDLTEADASRLVQAAERKFAHVLEAGEAESGFIVEDPGDMESALAYMMLPPPPSDEAEAVLSTEAQASAFDGALAMVLEHEGGFVDHPKDPGGATNKGITQGTYNAYLEKLGRAPQSVALVTDAELREIYYQGYWLPAHCDEMPAESLALLMFDAAVNHGPREAVRLLQRAAGVPDHQCDGKWGDQSRAQLNLKCATYAGISAVVEACLQKREEFYRRLVDARPSLSCFLKGWLNRVVSLHTHVASLLVNAKPASDTESLLLSDDGERVPLVAAPADFSNWKGG